MSGTEVWGLKCVPTQVSSDSTHVHCKCALAMQVYSCVHLSTLSEGADDGDGLTCFAHQVWVARPLAKAGQEQMNKET